MGARDIDVSLDFCQNLLLDVNIESHIIGTDFNKVARKLLTFAYNRSMSQSGRAKINADILMNFKQQKKEKKRNSKENLR